MAVVVTLTFILLAGYTIVILLSGYGVTRLSDCQPQKPQQEERVTVLIPFRNEAEHLPQLIRDLSEQDYPGNLLTVILVNDRSTDGSDRIADSMAMQIPGFRYLNLPEGRAGKKAALAYAVSHVETRWIIQIDADCRIGPEFITSHMAFLESCPSDLVTGFVTTGKRSNSFLESFQRIDLLGIAGAGAGSFHFGKPIMCSGANMLYSKELYLETRQFDPVDKTASGDDMFLLIGARKLKRNVSFHPGRKVMVETAAITGWAGMVRQHVRWGAKTAYYRMADIQFLAVLVATSCITILLSPVWVLLFPGSACLLAAAVGMKTMADLLLLSATLARTGQWKILWWFVPASLAYYPFMAMVIGAIIFRALTERRT